MKQPWLPPVRGWGDWKDFSFDDPEIYEKPRAYVFELTDGWHASIPTEGGKKRLKSGPYISREVAMAMANDELQKYDEHGNFTSQYLDQLRRSLVDQFKR